MIQWGQPSFCCFIESAGKTSTMATIFVLPRKPLLGKTHIPTTITTMIDMSPSSTFLTAKWSDFTIEKALRKDGISDTFKARLQNHHRDQEEEDSMRGTKTSIGLQKRDSDKQTPERNVFALKCLKKRSQSAEADRDAKALAFEIFILTQIVYHPSIIQVMGVSCQVEVSSSRFFCVLELAEETLADRLTMWRNKGKDVEKDVESCLERRIKLVAIKLAIAMDHVHTRGLCLGNLSPSTVGFDSMGNLKLIDLSEARLVYGNSEEDTSEPPKLPQQRQQQNMWTSSANQLRYKSPESFVNDQTRLGRALAYGKQPGDVYAFAVMLWEIMTLMVPYEFLDAQKNQSSSTLQRMMESRVSKRGVRPKLLRSAIPARSIRKLLEHAWDRDPFARPAFARICLTLSDEFGPTPAQWDLGAKMARPIFTEFNGNKRTLGEQKNNRGSRPNLDDEYSSSETDPMDTSFGAETESLERF